MTLLYMANTKEQSGENTTDLCSLAPGVNPHIRTLNSFIDCTLQHVQPKGSNLFKVPTKIARDAYKTVVHELIQGKCEQLAQCSRQKELCSELSTFARTAVVWLKT